MFDKHLCYSFRDKMSFGKMILSCKYFFGVFLSLDIKFDRINRNRRVFGLLRSSNRYSQ